MTSVFRNAKTHYTISGNGPAIVLLHGFLESFTMWDPLLPHLSKNYTVICIDLPGHGRTETLSNIHSMELMAEMVDFVIDSLDIKTASFIGHSMGGYVALAYLELYPSKIEKLILINSSAHADSQEKIGNRNRTIKLLSSHPKSFIQMAIGNLIASESSEKLTYEIEKLKQEAYSFPVKGLKAAVRGMRDRKDRTEILRDFQGMKFMILSKEDPILPIEEGRELANFSKSQLTEINGGHMSLIENTEAVLAVLDELFN